MPRKEQNVKVIDRIVKFFIKPKVPNDGMHAFSKGFKLADNPYRKHSAEHSIWRDDWLFSAGRYK